MAHWLELGAPPMSLPAVRFRTRLVQEFRRNIIFFALNLLHCFVFGSLGKTLQPQMLHLIQVKMSTW